MSQSLALIYVHLVFSTMDRQEIISKEAQAPLHAYMSVALRDLKCEGYRVGGTSDHVHLALRLAKTASISQVVEHVKTTSSKWMKKEFGVLNFAWQSGYGAFSFGPGELQAVLSYVSDQENHHRKISFQDEMRELFKECGMEYDERYVWK